MANTKNKINWIAIFAIVITLSLYLMSSITIIKDDVNKNTGNIQAIQTDMEWVKNAIQDASDGKLGYNKEISSNYSILDLFRK